MSRLADGDLVRIVDLLLVENATLRLQTSAGLLRGVRMRVETYSRFLELVDRSEGEAEETEPAISSGCASSEAANGETSPETGSGQGCD